MEFDEFEVGDRVRLKRDVDRLPDFIAKKGTTGTVAPAGYYNWLVVKMDKPIAGAEEWNNEIHWFDALVESVDGDLELIEKLNMEED